MTAGVSLKANGLKLRESLSCPEGGTHKVPDTAIIAAKATAGGEAICFACGTTLHLDPL